MNATMPSLKIEWHVLVGECFQHTERNSIKLN